MASKKGSKSVKSGLLSPLYSSGKQPSLGQQPVGGPMGGMKTPDPLGFSHGRGGKKGK